MRRSPCFQLALAGVLALSGSTAAQADGPPRVQIDEGDRIVLIGDDLIERDQKSGYLETILTLLNPARHATFRNLGWSGDTVFGDARAGFGGRADGFRHLKEHVNALKPTLLLVGYGMSESFDGEPGLASFESGFSALLDALRPTGARMVLLSPIAHEKLNPPLPDPALHNEGLQLYTQAIARIARSRGLSFVDLFRTSRSLTMIAAAQRGRVPDITTDGIHLNDLGSWRLWARVVPDLLGTPAPRWRVRINHDGKAEAEGTRLSGIRASREGVRFEATDHTLPLPPRPRTPGIEPPARPDRVLEVEGLAPGRYTLRVDGRPVASAEAAEWTRRALSEGPELDQVERLRRAINQKNRLYFYRWRPQNETYLFGFRKHEQGNNAREIPLFDPLVAQQEQEIDRLRVPVSHVYELVPESEAAR